MSFKNKVIYQIYPKSFQDTNGDGWGDIQGVIQHLDYLKELGIDYIWFNPMIVSPQKDNGYDVADYCNFDPRYGTMEDFEQLSAECKKRNIGIMFDMVFNHTSTEHEWFQKALQGDSKYKNYYIFKKGKPNGEAPNNWESKFGGPAWQYVESLDEWYLHLYDVTQADLNWDNPDVRKECANIVNFWRSKGVHGFRFDVVNLISKESFEDDPNLFDGRQFYTDGPHIHQYLNELNLNSFGMDEDHITVGEMSSTTLENCVKYAGANSHELDMVFSFHHLKVDYKNLMKWDLQEFDFPKLKELLFYWQTGMQDANAWNALFWNCHDQPRSVSRFGNDKEYRRESAKMLATTLHMMRGTPYVYQGEEIGMPNAYFTNINEYQDVESTNMFKILTEQRRSEEDVYHALQERSRDNARTPMPWNNSTNGGFTTGTPWLKLADSYKDINVESELSAKDSIFKHYQKLIQLRKTMPIVSEGKIEPLFENHPTVLAYKRTYNDEEMIVINQFYGTDATLDINLDGYECLLSNYNDTLMDGVLQLRPYESIVFYKK